MASKLRSTDSRRGAWHNVPILSSRSGCDLLAQKGDAAWDEIVPKYDEFSTREFLEQAGLSEGAIELFGILSNNEARMNYSFGEYFRSEVEHGFSHMVQIKGGTFTSREDGKLKRTSAGHYTSQVTVTLPSGWHGAFRYASCFRASPGSGMGDPHQSCPHLRLKF